MAFEIERKFLIKYPDADVLEQRRAAASGEVWQITQTYLVSPRGESRRLRRVVCGGSERYYFTHKRRVTAVTRIENEREIDRAEYESLLSERDCELSVIEKTRVRIPEEDRVWEVDLFPFWRDRALLEIELGSEDEAFALPPFVELIREVTNDRRYTNRAIAREIPNE